jgi:NTE family protein
MFEFLFGKKKKVALVLGGGSARGMAHIGVLEVLIREKIPIDMIVGTSMGAIVAAAFAVGIPMRVMKERAEKMTVGQILDPTMPSIGLLAGDKMELLIKNLLDERAFSDCKIPLSVMTTDIETGEEIIYHEGDLIKVIRASCSWPGIFNPVKIDGRLLVDGGIKNSVPTWVAEKLGADYVIAVDVGFCVKKGKIENIFQMLMQGFQIMGEELNRCQADPADSVIKVGLGDFDQTAFERGLEAIEKGAQAAEAVIAKIKKDLRIK